MFASLGLASRRVSRWVGGGATQDDFERPKSEAGGGAIYQLCSFLSALPPSHCSLRRRRVDVNVFRQPLGETLASSWLASRPEPP